MNVSAPSVSTSTGRHLAALAFSVTLTLFATSAAWSQDALDPVTSAGRADRAAAGANQPGPVKQPDAIPGASARAPAAPATKPAGDLQPNDALFDAINRGDIAAARDALNRGADLDATNVLGMTPMELSVDLSRNDISFLLLSMRGDDSDRGSRAVGRNTRSSGKAELSGKPAAPHKGTHAEAVARTRAPVAAERTRAPASAERTRAPVVVRPVPAPKRFANDGGAPLPSAGFLGFGSRPAAN